MLRAQALQDAHLNTDQIGMEMVDLVNEVATEIAKSHDWGQLTKVATINGTGTEADVMDALVALLRSMYG